ncbi:unnamed protein product, partial [Closterium sp. NIES-54]
SARCYWQTTSSPSPPLPPSPPPLPPLPQQPCFSRFSRPSPLLASIPAALELVLASRATNSSSRLSGCP